MNNNKLLEAMIDYYSGDSQRIQHFIKVYQYAKMIGEMEGLDEKTQFILETAAIVHDIGIKIAEEKYGDCGGELQEKEGPPQAEAMLSKLGYEPEVIERVSYLVGHHHTYTNVDGLDYQILLEADFLVNLDENHNDKKSVTTACQKIFKTATGIRLCTKIFGIDN